MLRTASFPFRGALFFLSFCYGKSRWKRSTGTFSKYRLCKRDTGRSGLVRSALEKLSLFSPTFSVCPEAWARGVSLSADSDLEGTCPLRESVLHLGACRLRRQIFREMKGKTEEILCGFPSIFLKYLGKDASKMCANRCKTDSKTSPAVLSWSSLMGLTISFLFVPAR